MTEALESYAATIASRCAVASAAGIRAAIRGLAEEHGWTGGLRADTFDDVMLELVGRGMVETIESSLLC